MSRFWAAVFQIIFKLILYLFIIISDYILNRLFKCISFQKLILILAYFILVRSFCKVELDSKLGNSGSILARLVLRVKRFWIVLVRVFKAQNWVTKFGFNLGQMGLSLQGPSLGQISLDWFSAQIILSLSWVLKSC